MSVVKFIRCSNNKCKQVIAQVEKEPDLAGGVFDCPKCGSVPRVSSKWGVSMYILGCNGKSIKHRKMIGTKKEAEAYERKMLTEREDGVKVNTERKDWSVSAFAPVFLGWAKQRVIEGKLAVSTELFYTKRLNTNILPEFGKRDMRTIDAELVDKYRLKRLDVVTPATVNKEVATLKRLLSIAVDKKWLKFNPLSKYELLEENNESDRYLSDDEIDALLASCLQTRETRPLYTMVMMGLNTGLRIEGVIGLRWEDVKWDTGEIHRYVKGGTFVRIPMTQELLTCLRTWQTRPGKGRGTHKKTVGERTTGFVFPSPMKTSDEPMSTTANFGLALACKRAGIEGCTYHTLRHTFATHFLEQHPDKIEVLMAIMGHTSNYITRRYAHITNKSRFEVMANFTITSKK